MKGIFKVSGTGCCLVDRLYNNVSFSSSRISPYLSRKRGDGGLTPGQLVFQEELEKFSGMDLDQILNELTEGRAPEKINIGGPAIVALINAAQITENLDCTYHFYGYGGKDEEGEFLLSSLNKTPVYHDHYKLSTRHTPSTIVLSDPSYDRGHGERMFINSIGGAWDFGPDRLDEDFFYSQMVVFGGTALVPQIHENLTELLENAKSKGCFTVVTTVFDFHSEKANPGSRWPMGKSDDSYKMIDLLIMDMEEALCLSGQKSMDRAMDFFKSAGTGALVVTNGADNIRIWSGDKLFQALNDTIMPVSDAIVRQIKKGVSGDTTGCGDNFAGGVIASISDQINEVSGKPDLQEACTWGIISGGFSCFYLGGTYLERSRGEKRSKILPYFRQYKKQING